MNTQDDISIERLGGLSVRTRGILLRHGVRTVSQALKTTDKELLLINGFGPDQVIELRRKLVEYGFLDPSALVNLPAPTLRRGVETWGISYQRLIASAASLAGRLDDDSLDMKYVLFATVSQPEIADWLRGLGQEMDIGALLTWIEDSSAHLLTAGSLHSSDHNDASDSMYTVPIQETAPVTVMQPDVRALLDLIRARRSGDTDESRLFLLTMKLLVQHQLMREALSIGNLQLETIDGALAGVN